MGNWAWFGIWVTLALAALVVFALIGRALFRSTMALGREAGTLTESMEHLSVLADELRGAAQAIEDRRLSQTPAPLRDLGEVRREFDGRQKALARSRRARSDRR